jgi:hypothetical protein
METAGHKWQTVNREVHQPEDLTIADVIEEIRAALSVMPEHEFISLAKAIDEGNFDHVGEYVADGFTRLNEKE